MVINMKWKMVLIVLCFCLLGMTAYADDRAYIVKFNDSMQVFGRNSINSSYRNFCSVSYDELQELLDMGVVEYYEPNCEIKLFEDYDDGSIEQTQWNLSAINIQKAWDIGCYGNDVRVAVIDSGVYAHTDLEKTLLTGYNYIDDSTDTRDNIGHGTYISGIIGAECNDEYVTGLAHQVRIVPLKCFDVAAKTDALMVANAIYDAVDVYDCDVINMSFGMDEALTNTTLRLSVAYAIQNGCIVVAAVGNDGTSKEYYPAKYDNVIGVGAIGEDMENSWFSQWNSTVDVVAPGENIQSIAIENYHSSSGTSFAAPHVSAVAAIAKCIDRDITSHEFMNILKNTAIECEADKNSGYDFYYGYGALDTEGVLGEVLKNTPVFLSPITNNTAKIYNNSGEDLVAKGIVANYEEDRLLRVIFSDIELLHGEIQTIDCAADNNSVKVMLWDNLGGVNPLYRARE